MGKLQKLESVFAGCDCPYCKPQPGGLPILQEAPREVFTADDLRRMTEALFNRPGPDSYSFRKLRVHEQPWLDNGSALTEAERAWLQAWESEWWRQLNLSKWLEATTISSITDEGSAGTALMAANRAIDVVAFGIPDALLPNHLRSELTSARRMIRAALGRSGLIPDSPEG